MKYKIININIVRSIKIIKNDFDSSIVIILKNKKTNF